MGITLSRKVNLPSGKNRTIPDGEYLFAPCVVETLYHHVTGNYHQSIEDEVIFFKNNNSYQKCSAVQIKKGKVHFSGKKSQK